MASMDHSSGAIWRAGDGSPEHASLRERNPRDARREPNTYMDTYFSEFPLPLKAALLVLAHLLVAGLLKAGFFFAGAADSTEPDATVWPDDAQTFAASAAVGGLGMASN